VRAWGPPAPVDRGGSCGAISPGEFQQRKRMLGRPERRAVLVAWHQRAVGQRSGPTDRLTTITILPATPRLPSRPVSDSASSARLIRLPPARTALRVATVPPNRNTAAAVADHNTSIGRRVIGSALQVGGDGGQSAVHDQG